MKGLLSSAILVVAVALAGCTVHQTEAPGLTGPSDLALSIRVTAVPDSISQDGGSQSSIQVTAIGPDGKPKAAVALRVDMFVGGVGQDYGTLSARTIVTNSSGVANVVYTAPPGPTAGIFGTCKGLPGNCVEIVATASGSGFETAAPEGVTIRLVPPGTILGPAASPTAAFTFSPQPATANVPLIFDGSASQVGSGASEIVSYNWTFGDGSNGTGKTATHTFAAQNSYTVKLTVTNDRGLSNSITQAVNVGSAALPTATFTVSPAAPGVGEDVFFNASTSTAGAGHTIVSYLWTFGDGATKTGITVSHDYGIAGSYSVQLKVTDEVGQSTTSAPTTVTVGSPPSPTSNFTFSPIDPPVGQQVVFDASTSQTAQGQTIVDVAWNFGDGTPVIHCPGDPSCVTTNGTNRISAHTYTYAGSFVVNLVVTDSAGRTGSKAQQIKVGSATPTAVLNLFKAGGNNILADASASTATGSATIVTYRFNWGDGTLDTVGVSSSASHGYAGAGPHTVTLTVTDSLGRTNTVQKDITTP